MQRLILGMIQASGVIAFVLFLKNLFLSVASKPSVEDKGTLFPKIPKISNQALLEVKPRSVLILKLTDTSIWNFLVVNNCITEATFEFKGTKAQKSMPDFTKRVISEIIQWNSGDNLNMQSGFKIVEGAVLVSVNGGPGPYTPKAQALTIAEAVEFLKMKDCGDIQTPDAGMAIKPYSPEEDKSFTLNLFLEDGSRLRFEVKDRIIRSVNYQLDEGQPVPFHVTEFDHLRKELIFWNAPGKELAPGSVKIRKAEIVTLLETKPITIIRAINILAVLKIE